MRILLVNKGGKTTFILGSELYEVVRGVCGVYPTGMWLTEAESHRFGWKKKCLDIEVPYAGPPEPIVRALSFAYPNWIVGFQGLSGLPTGVGKRWFWSGDDLTNSSPTEAQQMRKERKL